jgi:hypothetical protein
MYLGGDYQFLARRQFLQDLADDLLAAAGRIYVGRIIEVDARFPRGLEDRPALRLLQSPGMAAGIGISERHAADADAGDIEAAVAEACVLHGSQSPLLN